MNGSNTNKVFRTAKVVDHDLEAFRTHARSLGSNIAEMIAVGRRFIDTASPRQRIKVLREVRESGIESAAVA